MSLFAHLIPFKRYMPSFKSFEEKAPKIDIKDFFSGPIEAWGFLQSRSGEIVHRFHVDMVGHWEGEKGILTEQFTYPGGETQNRTWHFTKISSTRFTTTAEDSVGVGHGLQNGNAANIKFCLKIPVNNRFYDVNFNQWLIMIDKNKVVDMVELTKFGFYAGRLTAFFIKK